MRRVTCICCFVLFWAGLSLAQSTEKTTKPAERWNHALSKPLPSDKMGPFIRLSNRDILTVHDTEVFVSSDEGKTWICQACSEQNAMSFLECWKCQSERLVES